jgi:hypothetical protein
MSSRTPGSTCRIQACPQPYRRARAPCCCDRHNDDDLLLFFQKQNLDQTAMSETKSRQDSNERDEQSEPEPRAAAIDRQDSNERDATISGSGGVPGAAGVGGIEIKGARSRRGHKKTFQLSRLRPGTRFEHLLLVVRSGNPIDWTDLIQLDDLFWLGHVSRDAFVLFL